MTDAELAAVLARIDSALEYRDHTHTAETQCEIDRRRLAAELRRARDALRIIAGYKQCLDNLMSHGDVARAALGEEPADGDTER